MENLLLQWLNGDRLSLIYASSLITSPNIHAQPLSPWCSLSLALSLSLSLSVSLSLCLPLARSLTLSLCHSVKCFDCLHLASLARLFGGLPEKGAVYTKGQR